MGPTYAKEAAPLRPLLRPGAVFPLNAAQLKAIERLKELVAELHVLAVPDEAATAISGGGVGRRVTRMQSAGPLACRTVMGAKWGSPAGRGRAGDVVWRGRWAGSAMVARRTMSA